MTSRVSEWSKIATQQQEDDVDACGQKPTIRLGFVFEMSSNVEAQLVMADYRKPTSINKIQIASWRWTLICARSEWLHDHNVIFCLGG